uniref:Uncharacterized protein n=1 Tax=Anguilla anguilla TaxID=7936 RepID=A0A0E9SAI7_ANGAN
MPMVRSPLRSSGHACLQRAVSVALDPHGQCVTSRKSTTT